MASLRSHGLLSSLLTLRATTEPYFNPDGLPDQDEERAERRHLMESRHYLLGSDTEGVGRVSAGYTEIVQQEHSGEGFARS